MIDMTLNEYEAVRKDPNKFVVLPGHVYPEFERVVSENERYVLVAKSDEGGELARNWFLGRDSPKTFRGRGVATQTGSRLVTKALNQLPADTGTTTLHADMISLRADLSARLEKLDAEDAA